MRITGLFLLTLTALWLGILTSISPCPLSTNIAAVSFVSYRVRHKSGVILSGLFYTMGRSTTYIVVGFLILKAAVDIPMLSYFLQRYINKVLGLLLIIVGAFLLELLKINLPNTSISELTFKKLNEAGLLGAFSLGALFALAFCPVSAALFFGSLIPLAIKSESGIFLPLIYGIGTGLPVLFFAMLIAVSAGYINKAYREVAKIEFYTRRITGVVFILIGIYYVLLYTIQVL